MKADIAALLRAIAWLRNANASVRFEDDKTVSIRFESTGCGGWRCRRRKTLLDAVQAALDAMKGP